MGGLNTYKSLFQHTAARKWLAITSLPVPLPPPVSTHSRPKAAGSQAGQDHNFTTKGGQRADRAAPHQTPTCQCMSLYASTAKINGEKYKQQILLHPTCCAQVCPAPTLQARRLAPIYTYLYPFRAQPAHRLMHSPGAPMPYHDDWRVPQPFLLAAQLRLLP